MLYLFYHNCAGGADIWTLDWKADKIVTNLSCLTLDSGCFTFDQQAISIEEEPFDTKNMCIFPFRYFGTTFNSCIRFVEGAFWCATSVDADLEWQTFGVCNDLCPLKGMYLFPFKLSNQDANSIPLFLSGYKTSNKTSCTTIKDASGTQSNRTCILPFKHFGTTYNSCTLSWSQEDTEAWCATEVDASGEVVYWGVCELACQPTKLPEDTNMEPNKVVKDLPTKSRNFSGDANEKSKKVVTDSSTITIAIISITVLILLSIIIIYCCYVKRNKGKEENYVEIEGRSFPAGIVIKWSDIKMGREIGQGNFGKVYQGYVNMHQVQR